MYYLITIVVEDKRKTSFCTEQELFMYAVIPFSLTTTPASFQEMMNTILKDKEGCIWYLNNIHLYRGNMEVEHQTTVKKVLQQCVKHLID